MNDVDFEGWEGRLEADGLGDIELLPEYDDRNNKALARRNKRLVKQGKARPAWGYDGRRTASPPSPGLRKMTDPPGTGVAIRLMERAPAAWPSRPCPRLEGVCNLGRGRDPGSDLGDDYGEATEYTLDGAHGLSLDDPETLAADRNDPDFEDVADDRDEPCEAGGDDRLDPDSLPSCDVDCEPDDDRRAKVCRALAEAVVAERARPRINWPWFTFTLAVDLLTGDAEAETVAREHGARPNTVRQAIVRIKAAVHDQVTVSAKSVAQKSRGSRVIRPNTCPA